MKKSVLAIAVTIMTVSISMTVFAGTWKQDATGWWWQEDNGSYPVSCWQWIDGNGDGVAESYCFNEIGYLYINTTTPDNYTVNGDGAWTVNGVVQTKDVGVSAGVGAQAPAEQTQTTATQTTGTVQATARGQELYARLEHEYNEYRNIGWSRGDARKIGKAWGYSQAEIDYALSLVQDWNAEVLKRVNNDYSLPRGSYTDPYPTVTRSMRYVMLNEDHFTVEEIEYAIAHSSRDWNLEAATELANLVPVYNCYDYQKYSAVMPINSWEDVHYIMINCMGYTEAEYAYAKAKVMANLAAVGWSFNSREGGLI